MYNLKNEYRKLSRQPAFTGIVFLILGIIFIISEPYYQASSVYDGITDPVVKTERGRIWFYYSGRLLVVLGMLWISKVLIKKIFKKGK